MVGVWRKDKLSHQVDIVLLWGDWGGEVDQFLPPWGGPPRIPSPLLASKQTMKVMGCLISLRLAAEPVGIIRGDNVLINAATKDPRLYSIIRRRAEGLLHSGAKPALQEELDLCASCKHRPCFR